MSSKIQQRIVLWAVPRSLSTAFLRAMMNKRNTKVLMEPYAEAWHFGSERKSRRYLNQPPKDGCTYMDIKKKCEEAYPEFDTVFVKEMAYFFKGKLDILQYLPSNFQHTFILRHPSKSISSLYKMCLNTELTGWHHFYPEEAGYKELYEIFKLVTEQLGQEAVIVGVDDLLEHPETTLKLYCDKVGIEFEESMLNWEDPPQDMTIFEGWMPWFKDLLSTKTFQPSSTKPKSPTTASDLPPHVQRAIDDSMKYYDEMYAQRLKPNALLVA